MSTEVNDLLRQHTNFLILNWDSPDANILQPVSFTDNIKTWWQTWISDPKRKEELSTIIRYLLESLDDFVNLVIQNQSEETLTVLVAASGDSNIENTTTQISIKQSILNSFSKVYDSVMKLPLWLQPFSGKIKSLVVSVVAPIVLDYILRKYISG